MSEGGLGLLRVGSLCLGRDTRCCVNSVVVGVGNGFAVGRLEARSITTFGQIDFGVVVTARRKVDVNVRVDVRSGCLLVVMMSAVREFDFEVGVLGRVLFGSAVLNVNVCFSPARSCVILTGDVNFLSMELVASLWEVGLDGETFPSDARLS